MVSGAPKEQYKKELQRLEKAVDGSGPEAGRNERLDSKSGNLTEADAEAIREFLSAKDKNDVTVVDPDGESMEFSTLASYGQSLRVVATRAQTPLNDLTADDINQLMQSVRLGEHPSVKDSGLSVNTLIQHQSALRKFYRYHDFPADPESVIIFDSPDTSVDERDMFTRKEIQAMRDVIDNPRDRCLFELLINTGQRIRAIQTLRIKDVDTDKGVFWLNPEVDGLKGAKKNGNKRPLLGAKRAVYDWLQYHPTGELEDYLITGRPSSAKSDPGGQLHQTTFNRILKRIANEAGVDKPPNPHNFRHVFVTLCKRDYNLDNDTIKHLIGHASDSKVMETTYSHLTDEDHIEAAEVAAGIKEEPEDDAPLTPQVCPTCSEQLPNGAAACPACGTLFSPAAKSVQDELEEDMKESYKKTDPEDSDTQEKIDQLDDLLDDPDVKAALLEKLQE
jgi:integrase/recombinase XerD